MSAAALKWRRIEAGPKAGPCRSSASIFAKGRTTFVIAHRLATVRTASRILVFQNGRIVETGTFDALVERSGFFAELVKAQSDLAK
jgi:ABC-type multidrug transport system fused ATPase/permease subunit